MTPSFSGNRSPGFLFPAPIGATRAEGSDLWCTVGKGGKCFYFRPSLLEEINTEFDDITAFFHYTPLKPCITV